MYAMVDIRQTHPKEIARRLIRARNALGKSSSAFAEDAGLSRTQYANYEAGSRIGIDAAIKLCNAYPLTLDYIYLGEHNTLPSGFADNVRRAPDDPHLFDARTSGKRRRRSRSPFSATT